MGHNAPYHTDYNKYLTKNLLAYYDKNIPFFFGGIRRIAIGNRKKQENPAKKYTKMVYLANMRRSQCGKSAQKKKKKFRTYYYTRFLAEMEQEDSGKNGVFLPFFRYYGKETAKTVSGAGGIGNS